MLLTLSMRKNWVRGSLLAKDMRLSYLVEVYWWMLIRDDLI